jgi:hypothetical protein
LGLFSCFLWGWQDPVNIAHELAHSLGAVQNSAPNSNGAFHCLDGYDIICHNDDEPGFDTVCEDLDDRFFLDCGKNDYFNTDPSTSNYLYTHWNIANSRFLGGDIAAIALNKVSSKYNGWVTATLTEFSPGKRIYLSFDG